jgi:hypothetical protein
MSKKVSLPESVLEKAIAFYKETDSLSKTAKWINLGCPVNGIQTETPIKTTRHPLSRIFKERHVKVKPPNGGDINGTYGGYTSRRKKPKGISDPNMRFVLGLYNTLRMDLENPSEVENFLSACYYIVESPIHIRFCEHLQYDQYTLFRKYNISIRNGCRASSQYVRYLHKKKSVLYYNVWLSEDQEIVELIEEIKNEIRT